MISTTKALRGTIPALLLFAALLPSASGASCGTDITSQFKVQVGPQQNNNAGMTTQLIAAQNTGATMEGAVYLAVYNVPSGIGLTNFTWTSSCDSIPGAYFIRYYLGYQNQWDANANLKLALKFVNPQNQPFTFSYSVLKGDMLPSPHAFPGDFDGDRVADVSVYEPGTATWKFKYSSSNIVSTIQFGEPFKDRFVMGDFDGDLKCDIAVYRRASGTWLIRRSSDHVDMTIPFGASHDIPVPADYDGDGYTDLAVYKGINNQFQILQSTNGQIRVVNHGVPGAVPIPADYDGDNKADPTFFVSATKMFNILKSTTNQVFTISSTGFVGHPFAADFLNTGRSDMATYDPNTGIVFIRPLLGNTFYQKTLSSTRRALAGDFNGGFKADVGTYDVASGEWNLQMGMTDPVPPAMLSFQFGTPNESLPLLTIPSTLKLPLLP